MKHIDTMLSVFQRHSCICQVIIWTPEGPISYASESLIVIFLPWYNCYVYVLNGNKMFLNWIELKLLQRDAIMLQWLKMMTTCQCERKNTFLEKLKEKFHHKKLLLKIYFAMTSHIYIYIVSLQLSVIIKETIFLYTYFIIEAEWCIYRSANQDFRTLIIFTRETKPGTHKPIRFLVPFAISFITDQCNDDKLNKAIFLHHTILCLYCYFIFVSQWEDCFGQVWYVIVFPSKWHFIVCISVLNVYGNKIELLLQKLSCYWFR